MTLLGSFSWGKKRSRWCAGGGGNRSGVVGVVGLLGVCE